METEPLVHPLRHGAALQVMLEHCERNMPLTLVLNKAKKLLPVLTSEVVLRKAYQVLKHVHMLAPPVAHRAQALPRLGAGPGAATILYLLPDATPHGLDLPPAICHLQRSIV